jgi:hypothetical protein
MFPKYSNIFNPYNTTIKIKIIQEAQILMKKVFGIMTNE